MQARFSRRSFATTSGATLIAFGLSKAAAMDMAMQEEGSVAAELRHGLLTLWSEHMQYTMQVVDAYFNNPGSLEAYLNRLLRNQQDIGDALKPFYGEEAGQKQGDLLTEHITLAVPVLDAAKADDEAALTTALDDWYANAEANGIALSELNPENWPPDVLKDALRMHIDQTVGYSVALLQKDYESAIASYDEAHHHMLMLADVMADGIIAQFPDKFQI